ncbi:hypothetical protein [Halobacillus sp. BBL2006]|uniref:hypothetical protein n=1 Tax=Halobacillus sp. BBL2006 TaxID=1543706 RepID=UPI000542E7DD|nr:hypothetical protein [Halobacillus sp. BBL2006]KHE67109.1 hypothetical protein LD39_19225 [Halobacillus sp. BBL2006]
MKKVIDLLRDNHRLYLITLLCVFIFLIGSMAMTNLSQFWGQRLIIINISIMVYLMVFLGVDPILKGIFLTMIPFIILVIINELIVFVPTDMNKKWIDVDTARGGGPYSILAFITLVIVIKVFKITPYIRSLEEDVKKHP